MFKVGLENYTVYGKHGAFDFEHETKQPFVVSIWVELNNTKFEESLDKTINYAELQTLADNIIMHSPPIKLMETMISRMIDGIKDNQLVSKIKIRIEKPKAVLPNEGGLAIVEGEWPY